MRRKSEGLAGRYEVERAAYDEETLVYTVLVFHRPTAALIDPGLESVRSCCSAAAAADDAADCTDSACFLETLDDDSSASSIVVDLLLTTAVAVHIPLLSVSGS